jgi:hypothetical protein
MGLTIPLRDGVDLLGARPSESAADDQSLIANPIEA